MIKPKRILKRSMSDARTFNIINCAKHNFVFVKHIGDRKRRDTVQSIQYIPSMDCYLTASQKGAISIWNNKVRKIVKGVSCSINT